MRTLQRTKKTVSTLVLITLTSAGILYGIYWVIQGNIDKTIEFKNIAVERDAALETTKDLRKFVEEIDSSLELLNSRILAANGVASFIGILEQKARSLGLAIEIKSAAEEEDKSFKDYLNLKLELRSQGSWAATHRFLSYLETLPYNMSLPKVTLSSQLITKNASATPTTQWIGTYGISVMRNK